MLAWQIKMRVKKQMKLISAQKEKKILTKFCSVFYFIAFYLRNNKEDKFSTYYRQKLINLNIQDMQTIVEAELNNQTSKVLSKVIKWLKVDNTHLLFNIFSLYLKSLVLYDSIDNFKFFYDKKYEQKVNQISTQKFIEFLDMKTKINKDIKKMFKYHYGIIIDYINKNIGLKI